MDRKSYRLQKGERFISNTLLNNIVKQSDINKAIVEELNSELWFETLHGDGTVTFQNNIVFTGRMNYGILESAPQQTCSITFPNGTVYTGTMKNNKITGQGTYKFQNGSVYTGEVLNGLRHGYGVFTTENGIKYEGTWKNGLKEGKGKIIQGNMTLEGEWKDGIINGKGRIKWKSGNIYEGQLENNTILGNGYMVWYNNNEKYTGQWKNNLQDGYGTHIWYEPKGEQKYLRDRYVGEWRQGCRCGYGKFFYSNGSIYEGYWFNNSKEGYGILINQDRTVQTGYFKADRLIDGVVTKGDKQIKVITSNNQALNNSIITSAASETKSKKLGTSSKLQITKSNIDTNTKMQNDTKNLEIIKENGTKSVLKGDNFKDTKTSKDEEKSPVKKSKKQISKLMDEIKLEIDITDLIEYDPQIKANLKDVDNVLLRNLSLISHLYLYACGKESLRECEFGTSGSPSVTNETKSAFNNALLQGAASGKNIVDVVEEKKESVIEYDKVYNNDLYFCLDFYDLWRLLRECGLTSPDFTLSMINRLYFQNLHNYIEMYYLPDEMEENTEEEIESVYKYLEASIKKSKEKFFSKYKAQIQQGNIMLGHNNLLEELNQKEEHDLIMKQKNQGEIVPEEPQCKINYHDGKNIIMLRYFYELLVRIAFLKYQDSYELTLDQKLKNLFNYLKQFLKIKKKSLDNSLATASLLEIKLNKNWDTAIDEFYEKYTIRLTKLYKTIYSKYIKDNNLPYIEHDMCITYRYIFYNLLMKSDEKIQKIFENKKTFINIITLYHKDKVFLNFGNTKTNGNNTHNKEITSHINQTSNHNLTKSRLTTNSNNENNNNINNTPRVSLIQEFTVDSPELYCYIESLYDIEMIFFEFYELIFIIVKKYEMNYKKEEDASEEVLSLLENTVYSEAPKETCKDKFTYPKIEAHKMIEKAMEEAEERRRIEDLKNKEIERYTTERNNLTNENVNVYVEKKKDSEADSGSEYDS